MPLAQSYRGLMNRGSAPSSFSHGGYTITLGHHTPEFLSETSWQCGPLLHFPASSSDVASRRVVVPFDSVIRVVSMLTTVVGVKSSIETPVVVRLVNVTRGVEVELFSDASLFANSENEESWTSAQTSMEVAKFDEISVRIDTPNWSVAPADVTQVFQLTLERKF